MKSWPRLFEATLRGAKTHEVRKSRERDYQIGDLLRLQEFDPEVQQYTGRELVVRITYLTSAEYPCALSEDGCLNRMPRFNLSHGATFLMACHRSTPEDGCQACGQFLAHHCESSKNRNL